uniref:Aminomethyltransferase, mitochondrial n=1 Tax=Romanomermis culicivorax TaxID=13658 RepID=A0A915L631_ROMCU
MDFSLVQGAKSSPISEDSVIFQQAVNTFQSKGFDVTVEHVDQARRCLIAVQGPQTSKLFHALNCSIDFSRLYFMTSTICTVFGIENCRLSRCGYTGEDGVEISVDSARATELCEKLLFSKEASVKLAGLGARDSLRLEAGLCLYGHDIDETTTPVEAGLSWVIGRRRRETGDFPGAKIILGQVADKSLVKSKRIGFIGDKGRPPRSGYRILDDHDREIGTITSGCPSPCLKRNISMGYCATEFSALGSTLRIAAAGSLSSNAVVQVSKLPFLPTRPPALHGIPSLLWAGTLPHLSYFASIAAQT